jgi:hypothetical protein
VLEVNAAGIDIGAREIYVAVAPDRDADPVRVFSTFTEDLQRLAEWLRACRITTLAMESTGVYWIPLDAPRRWLGRHAASNSESDATNACVSRSAAANASSRATTTGAILPYLMVCTDEPALQSEQ